VSPQYVILDRDGVINQDSDEFIKSPAEWEPIPGSLEAIAMLNRNGFRIAVITNQSGIARGLFDEAALTAIHAKMLNLTVQAGGQIEVIYYCPHGPDSNCRCRKPLPGLFEQLALEKNIQLNQTFSVGDAYRDLAAGLAAGAKPVLVKTGKGVQTLQQHPDLPYPIFENLYDAATYIISTSG
jgi:D-glycero-D-manno-heptose 1,7-bisphosphate phosphatase